MRATPEDLGPSDGAAGQRSKAPVSLLTGLSDIERELGLTRLELSTRIDDVSRT
jgi:hypothetical protein